MPRAVRPLLLFLWATVATVGTAHAKPVSRVYLNGLPAPVFFNDGDSFTVLNGAYTGLKTRLSGFNTLESFGPVHRWGNWSSHELAVVAKMATLNARRGVWHCYSDLRRDGYGRALWFCPDLALDQVRKGLGHAMTVSGSAAAPELLQAQREAMAEKRGLWAKGVPPFLVTSIHSADEGYGGQTYNRLISTVDGHTEQWQHNDIYAVCQEVCHSSGACMRHVPFTQRYGYDRAACLKPDFEGDKR